MVKVPPHVLDELVATISPTGSVSLNPTPVNAIGFAAGLVMVNVSEVVAPNGIVVGLNALAIVGAHVGEVVNVQTELAAK